jgi:hypothetical protein
MQAVAPAAAEDLRRHLVEVRHLVVEGFRNQPVARRQPKAPRIAALVAAAEMARLPLIQVRVKVVQVVQES